MSLETFGFELEIPVVVSDNGAPPRLAPAEILLGSAVDKYNPLFTTVGAHKFAVHPDGFAMEISNVNPLPWYAGDPGYYVELMLEVLTQHVKRTVSDWYPKIDTFPYTGDAGLYHGGLSPVTPKVLAGLGFGTSVPTNALPRDVMVLKSMAELGCEPDKSAYTGRAKSPPSNTPMRACGIHIHLGYSDVGVLPVDEFARALDFISLVSLAGFGEYHHAANFLEGGTTKDYVPWPGSQLYKRWAVKSNRNRRTLYGQAGSYREKEYGLEYRALPWVTTPDCVDMAEQLGLVLGLLPEVAHRLTKTELWKRMDNSGEFHKAVRRMLDTPTEKDIPAILHLGDSLHENWPQLGEEV